MDAIKRYTVNFSTWQSTVDRIMKGAETAIVRDLDQAGPGGIMGNYYDVWFRGQLCGYVDTEAEALAMLKSYSS